MLRSTKIAALCGAIFLFTPWTIFSEAPRAHIEPALRSEAAALYDFETGTLLYSKNGQRSIPPASMSKLMTLHLVYRAVEEGEIDFDTLVDIGVTEDFRSLPPRSSLMFLEEGQRPSVRQLMEGLAVPSGNDAALALARLVSGSVDAFVEEMNREVRRIGLEDIHFADPAGLSAENSTTAEAFGRFCLYYISEHPESLERLHNQTTMTYPNQEVLESAPASAYGPITQSNYNVLVGRHPWVDGLKTGYIDEAGYNIALTAEHGGRRLVAVLLGGPGDSSLEGSYTRAVDGTNLLSYGFYAFQRIVPEISAPERLRVRRGERRDIQLRRLRPSALVVPAAAAGGLKIDYEIQEPIVAPVRKGQELGRVRVSLDGELVQEYPLEAGEALGEGTWWWRLWDSILMFLGY
ncbi:MAG TPA: D-alanyl-D-alanine carboxypeptidase [Sediminispirochaeta sp.]|nr:D-alanyl-D-alanine carboxypeptidase [Sediminispirochaeta sp.]